MSSPTPLTLIEMAAPAEWMDYNGHMNVAHYTSAVDRAMDVFLNAAGMGEEYMEQEGGSMFVLQQQFHYLREIREGESFEVTGQMLGVDARRLHIFLHLQKPGSGQEAGHGSDQGNGAQFATCELMAIHVNIATRKSAPLPEATRVWLVEKMTQHQALPRPHFAGHKFSLKT